LFARAGTLHQSHRRSVCPGARAANGQGSRVEERVERGALDFKAASAVDVILRPLLLVAMASVHKRGALSRIAGR